jgi:TonB family protein
VKNLLPIALLSAAGPFLLAQGNTSPGASSDPIALLRLAAPYYDYAGVGMKPWRARYHYQYYGADGQLIVEGQFDYWSAKGRPSKAAWTHGDQSHVEWHTTDGKELRSTSGKDVEGMEHRLYFALVPYFLKLADPQSTEQLKSFTSKYESKQLACVGRSRSAAASAGADSLEIDWPAYCFEEHEPTLVASHENGSIINAYGHVQKFQNHNFPGDIQIFLVGKKRLDAKLEELSEVGENDPAFTPSPDAKEPPPPTRVTVPAVQMKPLVITHRVQPDYPVTARQAHISGVVVITATIGKDGKIKDAQVTSSPDGSLSAAALDAVRQWRYEPYAPFGQPTEIHTTIQLNFTP